MTHAGGAIISHNNMDDDVREIHLQRSESLGFGFSIIGGFGSELPPVICDIVENSPAFCCSQVCISYHVYIVSK